MSYTPVNIYIYTAAFAGAFAGMGASDRIITSGDASLYAVSSQTAAAFAQAIDIAWANSATPNLLEYDVLEEACEGFWNARAVKDTVAFKRAAYWTSYANALVAFIQQADNQYAADGISPPPFPMGGGGSNIPDTTAIGQTLQSIGIGPVSPSTVDWDFAGGFQITGFSGVTQLVKLGTSIVNPAWAASFNETPDTQNLDWTNPNGTEALTPGQTSGIVPATFVSNTNGATSTATLRATHGATSRASTQTMTWGSSVLINPAGVDPSTLALTPAWINAHLPSETIRATAGGSYAKTSGGAPNLFFVAIPTILAPGTWTIGGFTITPTTYGNVPTWQNSNGVTQSMTIISLGSAGADGTYAWGP